TADAFYFEVRTYSGAIVYWDDFSVFKESAANPALGILSPGNGDWVEGQDVDVTISVQNFDVANGTADGHIHYSVDGGDTVMKYDTDPIALTGLSFGSHSITVELVDNSHAALATPITAISTFNTYQIQTLPITEDFEYADGSLSDNPSWNSFSGTAGDLLVSSGQAVVQHGTASEDVNITFNSGTGDVFYALDFTVVNPGGIITGNDYEYFAILKDDSFAYRARLDVAEALSGGDFTIGISTEGSTADAVWATDLSYGTTYRATVRFNQESNTSELWIDATASTDTSILGLDGTDPGTTVTQFALRQSDSSLNESILIDNLIVSQTFNETLSSNNLSAATDFNLYPNPTKSDFINITSTGSGAMQAAVFDILGKQVINTTVSNKRINISTLHTGIYIVKLTQGAATTTKKLIIQ
ncbi:T9SS type A sorting domain-containing protein, partial [Flavobacteriaceae bacterium]|nr:T9SS type A sorting domain-containing protein [Flavobacteriaceae bacterium]